VTQGTERPEATHVIRKRGATQHSTIAAGVAIGIGHRYDVAIVLRDPLVEPSKFLLASTVLPEITPGELAPRVHREARTEAPGGIEEFSHHVDVDLRGRRDKHYVMSLLQMPAEARQYPVATVIFKVSHGE
jgi:hypothetical protein